MTRREIRKLDKLWSEAIKSKRLCEYCGKEGNNPHHIFSRSRRSTRWDLDNGLLLCLRHHLYFAHTNPIEFTWWIEKYIGIKELERLRKKSQKIAKNQDFERIKEYLER